MSYLVGNGPSLYLFSSMTDNSVPIQIINYKITLAMVDVDPHTCTTTRMAYPAYLHSGDIHTHLCAGTLYQVHRHTIGPSRHQHPWAKLT